MVDDEDGLLRKIDLKYILQIIVHYIDIVSEKISNKNTFLDEEIYIIKHHYYRDFFIALYVVNEIKLSHGIPNVLATEILPLFILELIGNILREHYNVPIIKNGKWSVDHFIYTPLQDILKRISDVEEGNASIVLQNVLNIWERARNGYIVGEVFENVDLTNCNFSNLIFSVKDNENKFFSRFYNVKSAIHLKQFLTEGHMGVVNCLSFSPDYKLLVSASTDCNVKVWNVVGESLSLYKTFSRHKKSVKYVKFLKNGYDILSCSIDGTVRKWNILSNKSQIIFEIDGNINYFDINEQENKILVCQNNYLIVEYDTETKEITTYKGHTGIVNKAIYASDKILSCAQNGEIFAWDTIKHEICCRYPQEECSVNCIIYGKKSKRVMWATEDGKIVCYNSFDKVRFEKQESTSSILYLSMNTEENKVISCGDDRIIHEWEIIDENLVSISSIVGHGGSVNCALYNMESTKIYSGSWDNTIQIWESLLGINISQIKGTRNWINHLCINKNQDKMLVSCWNGDIQEWNIHKKKCIRIFHGHLNVVNKAIYNLDETKILSCSYDKTVREWDVNTGQCCRVMEGHDDCVIDIEYDLNNHKVVSCSFDGKVIEWKLFEGEMYEYDIVVRHMDYVNGIKYSSDGKRILSYSDDGFIIEWIREKELYERYDLRTILDGETTKHEIKYATYISEKEILFVSWHGVIGKITRESHKVEILYELEIPYLQIENVYYHKMSNVMYLCGADYGIYKVSLDTRSFQVFSMHDNLVKSIFITDKGQVYTGGWEGGVCYWENDFSEKEEIFYVLMGIYIDNCEFNSCVFKDEQTSTMINAYNGKLYNCKVEK